MVCNQRPTTSNNLYGPESAFNLQAAQTLRGEAQENTTLREKIGNASSHGKYIELIIMAL